MLKVRLVLTAQRVLRARLVPKETQGRWDPTAHGDLLVKQDHPVKWGKLEWMERTVPRVHLVQLDLLARRGLLDIPGHKGPSELLAQMGRKVLLARRGRWGMLASMEQQD